MEIMTNHISEYVTESVISQIKYMFEEKEIKFQKELNVYRSMYEEKLRQQKDESDKKYEELKSIIEEKLGKINVLDYKTLNIGGKFNFDLPIEFQSVPETHKDFSKVVFSSLYGIATNNVYIYIEAFPQMGKTSVITCVSLYAYINWKLLDIDYNNIFIISGINDVDWKKQTGNRLFYIFKDKVYHNPDLKKLVVKLKEISKNNHRFLIIWDESHIASKKDNSVYRNIEEIKNIFDENSKGKMMTLSATNPVEIAHIKKFTEMKLKSESFKMPIDPGYNFDKLFVDKRVRETQPLDKNFINHLLEQIDKYKTKKYHFIRVSSRKKEFLAEVVEERIENLAKKRKEKYKVLQWNYRTKLDKSNSDEINDIISIEPKHHTIYLIMDMYRAAKTLIDKNIGLMVDYYNPNQGLHTTLQSLLGRACGYNRSNEVIVYTNIENAKKARSIFKNGWMNVVNYKAPNFRIDKSGNKKSSGLEIQNGLHDGKDHKIDDIGERKTEFGCIPIKITLNDQIIEFIKTHTMQDMKNKKILIDMILKHKCVIEDKNNAKFILNSIKLKGVSRIKEDSKGLIGHTKLALKAFKKEEKQIPHKSSDCKKTGDFHIYALTETFGKFKKGDSYLEYLSKDLY